jgi:hypothetical protein
VEGRFSTGTPISSTNKIVHHVIAEILLKVALNTIILFQSNPKQQQQQQQNTNDRATYGSVLLDFHYKILLDI